MNRGRIWPLLLALVVIGVIVLGVKIVGGAFNLVGSAVNAVLGIVVILALVAIVIWMFRYAKRH